MTLINIISRKISFLALAFFIFAPFSAVSSQVIRDGKPKVVVAPRPEIRRIEPKIVDAVSDEDNFVEKSIAVVDPKVNIYLCLAKGNLKVTGWERNEIRVFVSNGSGIGFKIQQKNKQNNPILLTVSGIDTTKERHVSSPQGCISGEDIELDVPRGAYLNIRGRTSETTINSVRKVEVKNVGGDITLRDIEQGIAASTYQGDVIVENSNGAIRLETTNGNILASGVAPAEIGDIFRVKTTSGAISLQGIEHRQNEITSNSGSIKYIGGIQSGGQYDFRTQNGTISLAIPEKSSCKINASYGFGAFNSEIKLDNLVKNNESRAQSLTALMGSGDATVNLTTYSGSIRLRKQ